HILSLMLPQQPTSTLFPYTTLFRSRDCEDCRDQALPGVLSRIRRKFYLSDADESLRAERQFRSGNITCTGGAHTQSARSQNAERSKANRVGNWETAPRIFARGRSCVSLSFTAGEI